MSVEIKFIGHSCFMLKNNGHSLIIDPFISGNPNIKQDIDLPKSIDILITHAHGDHLGDAVEISKNTGSIITCMYELAEYCYKKGALVQGINLGGKIAFKWGSAYWLPASHSSSNPDGSYGGEPASILVEVDGKRIYHAGDTGLHYDLKMVGDFYKPEMALVPIGGYYSMGIDEAVQAVKWLGCKYVIPMHYNTFPPIKADPEEFKGKVESETDCKCIILEPGEIYSL